jgi:hypothetical protein
MSDNSVSDNHVNETMTSAEYQARFGRGGDSGGQQEAFDAPPHRRCSTALALDPGSTTGVAFTDGSTVVTAKTQFWDAVMAIDNGRMPGRRAEVLLDPVDTAFIVEAPQNAGVVHQRLVNSQQSRTSLLKIAQNSGSVQREAALLIAGIRRLYGPETLIEHTPTSAKWDARQAEQIVGPWDGPNNEHTRDALAILFLYNFI